MRLTLILSLFTFILYTMVIFITVKSKIFIKILKNKYKCHYEILGS